MIQNSVVTIFFDAYWNLLQKKIPELRSKTYSGKRSDSFMRDVVMRISEKGKKSPFLSPKKVM